LLFRNKKIPAVGRVSEQIDSFWYQLGYSGTMPVTVFARNATAKEEFCLETPNMN
jgi:hypothetical protein